MRPIEFIRRQVFGATQKEFGFIAKASQTTVCRWEKGEHCPDVSNMDSIRSEALERGLEWNDTWFFEVPVADEVAA